MREVNFTLFVSSIWKHMMFWFILLFLMSLKERNSLFFFAHYHVLTFSYCLKNDLLHTILIKSFLTIFSYLDLRKVFISTLLNNTTLIDCIHRRIWKQRNKTDCR